jgi:hypothetical protein
VSASERSYRNGNRKRVGGRPAESVTLRIEKCCTAAGGCPGRKAPARPEKGRKRLCLRAGELIAAGGFCHPTVFDERGKGLADIAGAHAHDIADLLLGEGFPRFGEDLFDAFAAGWLDAGGSWLLIDGLQHRRILRECKWHPVSARSGAMLDAELQLAGDATHIEV